MQATKSSSADWQSLPAWSAAAHLPHELVHGPASGRLHLHVYSTPLTPPATSSETLQPTTDGTHPAATTSTGVPAGAGQSSQTKARLQSTDTSSSPGNGSSAPQAGTEPSAEPHARLPAGGLAHSHKPVNAEALSMGECGRSPYCWEMH